MWSVGPIVKHAADLSTIVNVVDPEDPTPPPSKEEAKENMERRQRLVLTSTSNVKKEEQLRDIRGVKRTDTNENVFTWPNGLRENAGTAILGRGPGPARKKRYSSSREEEEDGQVCLCGKTIRNRTHRVENVNVQGGMRCVKRHEENRRL